MKEKICFQSNKTNKFSSNYSHEDQIESQNLISKDSRIEYIGLNLLLKKIAFEDLFEFEFDILLYFIYQFQAFIMFKIFFEKLKNLFKYYTNQKSINNFLI